MPTLAPLQPRGILPIPSSAPQPVQMTPRPDQHKRTAVIRLQTIATGPARHARDASPAICRPRRQQRQVAAQTHPVVTLQRREAWMLRRIQVSKRAQRVHTGEGTSPGVQIRRARSRPRFESLARRPARPFRSRRTLDCLLTHLVRPHVVVSRHLAAAADSLENWNPCSCTLRMPRSGCWCCPTSSTLFQRDGGITDRDVTPASRRRKQEGSCLGVPRPSLSPFLFLPQSHCIRDWGCDGGQGYGHRRIRA